MQKYSRLLSFVLAAGVIFAFYTVYNDFTRFYDSEGTIFKIKDCALPNPVVTPCFYGAFAFLGAFIWSVFVKNRKYLRWFLVFGVIFAWTSFSLEIYKFTKAEGQSYIGCSGAVVDNPFGTPCFYGAVIFLLSMIIGFMAHKERKRNLLAQKEL